MLIALQWEIATADLAALLAGGYDEQQVQLSPAWDDLLRADQRLPLLAQVERYCCTVGGDAVGTYRVVPTRSSDDATTTPITAVTAAAYGYCTIADVRAEGYAALAYPDARVQEAIDQATATIDDVCGQTFAPRRRRVSLDVDPDTGEAFLDAPCCAVWQAWDAEDQEMPRTDLVIYNRHLTEGLRAPDDRRNPRVALRRELYTPAYLTAGRRQLVLDGVFGYTDLDGVPGETARGSQIPLTYGRTPLAIRRACLLLAVDLLATLAAGGSTAQSASRVISEKTKDQSYTLQALPAAATTWGLTGNAEADGLLQNFMGPLHVGVL